MNIRLIPHKDQIGVGNEVCVNLTHEAFDYLCVKETGKKEIQLGASKKEDIGTHEYFLLFRRLIQFAKHHKISHLVLNFSDFVFEHLPFTQVEIAQIMTTQSVIANYEYIRYKNEKTKQEKCFVQQLTIVSEHTFLEEAFKRGAMIGQEMNACRDISNTPGADMTPSLLVHHTAESIRQTSIKMTVLEKEQMEHSHMGGVLAVSKGSLESPKFIILEYMHNGYELPIVLVGKAVTFDAGGLNLKPEQGMLGMHMDMAGGASVIHTITLAAKLGLKKNIVALIPAVENMPSGHSYRPGDVIKTMSGTTVEVVNTDAEGRLILADALTYAKKFNPKLVIDVATLTGASLVALGQRANAVFTHDKTLEDMTRESGEKSGDYVWPLPLWKEYRQELHSHIADIANLPPNMTRFAGCIHGAIFLHEFAKDYPWMHIDMAPRMTCVKGEYLAEGASGSPVNLLITLLDQV